MNPAARSCLRPLGLAVACAATWQLAAFGNRAITAGEAEPKPDAAAAAQLTAEQIEVFESRIRPILVERCIECHGPDAQEAGLRLDLRKSVFGDNSLGEAMIVPGNPDKSRLVEAVRYRSKIQMPPDGKLADEQIAAFVDWVAAGAPWPEATASADPNAAAAAATPETMPERIARSKAEHWAYQPVARPKLPAVRDERSWVRDPIDAFILARLQEASLTPSPAADRRTLIRRATFDLIGLPPTAEEVADFERDDSPDAFAKVIDRLLASPHYGERWARYWLDVARYSDTKGYVFTEDRRYPYSYTYRDYVVRALNEDVPFDRFVLEQLAADQLDLGDEKWRMAAMGFLTVGRRFSNNTQDIIDDRIDVVSRGLLGLTVTCARCHDHKYDAIPTHDYYSLYGVFASCTEPQDQPLIAAPEATEAFENFQAELAKLQSAHDTFFNSKRDELFAELSRRAGDYLSVVVVQQPDMPEALEADLSFDVDELRPEIVRRWRRYIRGAMERGDDAFRAWGAYGALKPEEFADKAGEVTTRLLAEASADVPATRLLAERLRDRPPKSMVDVAKAYGELLVESQQAWTGLLAQHSANQSATTNGGAAAVPERLADEAAERLRQVLYGEKSPLKLDGDSIQRNLPRTDQEQLKKLRLEVDQFKTASPDAPARAMVLNDSPQPHEQHVFIRGNSNRPGDVVPRQFLQVLTPGEPAPFARGSGRLELAERIASAANPLTARVIVNRVWLHHFGAGLVRTPSDFGIRGEPPTHPELLDELAAAFMADGWSLKRLHRRMMLSSAYRQASFDRSDARALDAENRLLWRMNRQRLDFEAMRDAVLATAGTLDRTVGGRSTQLFEGANSRRTLYAFIDRQDLPGVFRVFDFASPDVSTPQRPQTTVPQQALFAMNAPFVVEQAKALAARVGGGNESTPAERVEALYQAALARSATTEELNRSLTFLALADDESAPPTPPSESQSKEGDRATQPAPLDRLAQLAQALLMTNEFMFVD